MPSQETVQVFIAIAALLQVLVLIIAALFAKHQISEMKSARSAAIYLSLYEEINSPEAVERRRIVYSSTHNHSVEDIPETVRKDINNLINQLDFLGFMVESDLVSLDLIAPFYYGTVIRCWDATREFVMSERLKRSTMFAEYFEKLFVHCKNYVARERPSEHVYYEKWV
jgi:Domain of unknown function (DUF4760)